MGGLSQDQDASYRAALCCLSEGRRLRGFPLILCWRIWEGPLLMIRMLRPIADSQAGARPCSCPHSYTADIKDWPVEGWMGQTDLARRIVDWCKFIPTNVFFFPSWKGMLLMQQWCVFVRRVCICSSCFLRHIRSSWTPLSSFKDTPPSCTSPSLSLCLHLSFSLALSHTHTHTHTSHIHTLQTHSHFLSLTLWQAMAREMAADILDSKRLKVECVPECMSVCVCVCVSKDDRGTSQCFLHCISASYLSERCCHTQNLEQHTGAASVSLSPFCFCLTACQSSMIMIIGCEVNNLLISAKWELD